jgi:ubiquinone/menaquinone biosynthesis C-methylase UbiE
MSGSVKHQAKDMCKASSGQHRRNADASFIFSSQNSTSCRLHEHNVEFFGRVNIDLWKTTGQEPIMTAGQIWDKRVRQWHSHVTSSEAFADVLSRILLVAQPQASDVCVDLGAGTGFVTTALAPLVSSVHAVDISPAMTEALADRAADTGLTSVSTEATDLRFFRLPPSYADLIVSSYALHHLTHADKRALTVRMAQGLRPGGRLVIADMMFGRGRSRRDRTILRQKIAALAAKGIGGWWRIVKNLTRYGLCVGTERPATPEFWEQALCDAGLAEVSFQPVTAEAGIVCGVRPSSRACPVDHWTGSRSHMLIEATSMVPW